MIQKIVKHLGAVGISGIELLKKAVHIHTGVFLKAVDGAIAFQTAALPAVASAPAGNQPHMLQNTAVKSVPYIDLASHNQRSAQVFVQSDVHRVLDIRVLPKLGKGGNLRIVEQRAVQPDILLEHRTIRARIAENIAVNNGLAVSGNQALYRKADSQNLVIRALQRVNELIHRRTEGLVVFLAAFKGNHDRFFLKRITA